MVQVLSQQAERDYRLVMEQASSLELTREQIASILGISESTQFRYEKKNPTLKPNLWDRWSRLIRVVEIASNLFEDELEVKRWLTTPKRSLDDRVPVDLLSTDMGSRQVEQILLQASYGIF